MLLAFFRESNRLKLLFRREAGNSATPPQGLSALHFFERGVSCSCSSLPLLLSSLPSPAVSWQLSGAVTARHALISAGAVTARHALISACACTVPDNISVAGGAASYRFPLLPHFMEAHNG